MFEYSPEPWVIGWWEPKQVGHKLYYSFYTKFDNVHFSLQGIFSGVKDGATVHCSDFNRGRGCGTTVVGLAGGEDSDVFLVLSEKDARRIVACVNFCKGIDNETLEERTLQ